MPYQSCFCPRFRVCAIRLLLIFLSILFPGCYGNPTAMNGPGDEPALPRGRFAAEVMAYRPAPGQFVQRYGDPARALGIPDGQVVSLGGLGGSITLRLADPIKNRPGPDFVVWGNALYRGEDVRKRWAEPAVIEVSDNGHDWFVIAGSLFADGIPESHLVHIGYPKTNDAVWPGGFSGVTNLEFTCHDLTAAFSMNLSKTDGWSWTNAASQEDGLWGQADSTPGKLPLDEDWTMDDPLQPGIQGAGGDALDLDWARTANGGTPPATRMTNIRYLRLTTAVRLHAGELGEFSSEIDALGVPW
ncbi:MAG TPA: hypothetical protein PK297_04330 [Spirochaetota bacterium]|nr:hypothetical protein [Spirochaetota bacterium]